MINNKLETSPGIAFQFLVVRLDDARNAYRFIHGNVFQFLVVRLDAARACSRKVTEFISIPCGAIRCSFKTASWFAKAYFNSLWCD